jgi:Ca2+-binding RTX toxin-like protein
MRGGAGGDLMYGDDNQDLMNGNTGNDTMFGGGANDTMWGDEGNDTLTGGPGFDRFIFDGTIAAGLGDDIVLDFNKTFDDLVFNGMYGDENGDTVVDWMDAMFHATQGAGFVLFDTGTGLGTVVLGDSVRVNGALLSHFSALNVEVNV